MATPREILKQHFGFDQFREGQEEAIQRALNGQHTLLVMPTGSGKSLAYQLPALMQPGITLVISPLIALMQDQVDSLTEKGIPATFINSMLPVAEVNRRTRAVLEGYVKLLYIAPERFRNRQFTQALARTKVSLLAVDEAHCISQWGHDFRPDYLHIGPTWQAMGQPTLLATTATATPAVQKDIVTLLGLEGVKPIVTGFNRPNLTFRVITAPDLRTKLQTLQAHLARIDGSAIIYCATRRNTDEVTDFIRDVLKLPAQAYHAGLDRDTRYRVQTDFMADRLKIVVATNAFGMGVDKAGVRTVIHYNMPATVEAYYQEAGRAGRDGKPAECVMLFTPDDQRLQEWLMSSDTPTQDDLHQVYTRLTQAANGEEVYFTQPELAQVTGLHPVKIRVTLSELEQAGAIYHMGDEGGYGHWKILTPPPDALNERARAIARRYQIRLNLLQSMLEYVYLNRCRRQFLLNYFGDTSPPRSPRCCDNHTADSVEDLPKAVTPQEWYPLIVLETIRSLAERPVGRSRLAQLLNGSKAKPMQEFGYERHKFYGKLNMLSQPQITGLIDALLAARYLQLTGGELPVLYLTELGSKALEARAALPITVAGLPASEEASVEHRKKRAERPETVIETLALFRQGLSPAQIAAERELSETTVYLHLARLLEKGEIELRQVVAPEVEAKVLEAIKTVGTAAALSPIKTVLPEEISYEQIRCVIAAHPELSREKVEPTAGQTPEQRVVALGESRDPAHVPELISALRHEDGNIRRLAASALGKIGDPQAVEPLMSLLGDEPRPQVRQYALKALGRLADPRARPLLEQIANDPEEVEYNRTSAQVALARLADLAAEAAPSMPAEASPSMPAETPVQPSEPAPETPDVVVLNAVAKLGGTLGRTGLAQLLTGSKADWLESFSGHTAYGQLAYLPQRAVFDIIDALIAEGRLRLTGGHRPKVILPEQQIHANQAQPAAEIALKAPPPPPPTPPDPPTSPAPVETDTALLETLRLWRTEQARAQQVPPYIILSNKALEAIATQRPTTKAALATINGIGPAKLEQYGGAILALLNGQAAGPAPESQDPTPAPPPTPAAPSPSERQTPQPSKKGQEALALSQAIIQVVTDLEGLITAESLAQLLVAAPNEIVSFSDHALCGRFHGRLEAEAVLEQIQELVKRKEVLSGRSGRLILP